MYRQAVWALVLAATACRKTTVVSVGDDGPSGAKPGGNTAPAPLQPASGSIPASTWICSLEESFGTRDNGYADLSCRLGDSAEKSLPGRFALDSLVLESNGVPLASIGAEDAPVQCEQDGRCRTVFRIGIHSLANLKRIVPRFSRESAPLNSARLGFPVAESWQSAARRGDARFVAWTSRAPRPAETGRSCVGLEVELLGQCAELDEAEDLFAGALSESDCSLPDAVKVGGGQCRRIGLRTRMVSVGSRCAEWTPLGVAQVSTLQGCVQLERY